MERALCSFLHTACSTTIVTLHLPSICLRNWVSTALHTQEFKILSPVLKEPSKTKCHQLQNRLEHKNNGEDIVAVLQGFIQGLQRERHQLDQHKLSFPRAPAERRGWNRHRPLRRKVTITCRNQLQTCTESPSNTQIKDWTLTPTKTSSALIPVNVTRALSPPTSAHK